MSKTSETIIRDIQDWGKQSDPKLLRATLVDIDAALAAMDRDDPPETETTDILCYTRSVLHEWLRDDLDGDELRHLIPKTRAVSALLGQLIEREEKGDRNE